MRVMFVDDEKRVLEGIERSLFSLDLDWELFFAGSGRDALDQLNQAPVEVVVSDMRMPGMNGRELLSEVRTRWPDTVRVILSGHAEEELALRSLGVAHQFLAKPCDGAELVKLIGRTISLQTMLRSTSLKRLAGKVEHLPPTPKLYIELTRTVSNPETSAKSIASILARDPALSTKVLQVANSAFFHRGKPVTDICAAVTHLGMDTIRLLILVIEVFADASNEGAAAYLQRRALRTALIAQRISVKETFSREAMTAGLLTEVGLLIPGVEVYCKQAETMGEGRFSYVEVGAYLLGLWGLPPSIIETVAYHCEPEHVSPDSFALVSAVYIASKLARGEALNNDYLAHLGVAHRLEEWQEYAKSLEKELA